MFLVMIMLLQKIKEQKDRSLILTLTVNHLLELKRWILSWGSGATVLEPKVLKDDIQKELTEMKKNYTKK